MIGRQTRTHGDLDIVVQEKDVPALKEILEPQGYKILNRDDLAYNYLHMADDKGHEIDVTAIIFDEHGNGIWGPIENNEMNPADSFAGRGTINNHYVKCISLEYAIKFRLDHEPWTHDIEDVKVLCEEFNLSVPVKYLGEDLLSH